MAGANTKISQAVKSAVVESQRRTVSVEEAGHILGVSRGSAYTLARTGALPTIRLASACWSPRPRLRSCLRHEGRGHEACPATNPPNARAPSR